MQLNQQTETKCSSHTQIHCKMDIVNQGRNFVLDLTEGCENIDPHLLTLFSKLYSVCDFDMYMI